MQDVLEHELGIYLKGHQSRIMGEIRRIIANDEVLPPASSPPTPHPPPALPFPRIRRCQVVPARSNVLSLQLL